SSASQPVRPIRAGRPCAPAAPAGFPPDIACRRTDRGPSDPSGTYAETHSPTASRTISRKHTNQFRRDLIERQNGGADPRIGGSTGHSPHHAGRFVLGNHAAAGRHDLLAAAHTVPAHAGPHH